MKAIIDKITGQFYYCTAIATQLIETQIEIDNLPQISYDSNFETLFWDFQNQIYYKVSNEEELAAAKKASVPETVSRRQLRLALVLSSFDLSMIDAQINQLPEPNRSFALIAWNDAIVFERKDALLNQLAGQLGLSEDNLDDLFINASKL